MQATQWTPELFAIVAFIGIAMAAIGYLVAKAALGRAVAQLTTQLAQSQQELNGTKTTLGELKDCLSQANAAGHQHELDKGKLQEQLGTAQANEKRLVGELGERKEELAAQLRKLDDARQLQHAAEKQCEAAEADVRSLKEQISDLRARLEKTDQTLEQERKAVSNLKELLTEEGKKANASDAASKETREQISDLRDRLAKANQTLDLERKSVSDLKEMLAQEGKRANGFEAASKETRDQLTETKQSLTAQINTLKELQERYQSLSTEHTELKTTLARKEEHFKEQMQQLSETKHSLTKEFENLANKIFEEKGKTFTHTSQASIDNMLKPFREQIDAFQKRVNEVHDASKEGNANLNAEIKKVLDIGLQMRNDATNLTSALKGDSQQRGAWGEAQLRRTLEMSGLIEDAHFDVQSSFKDAEGKQKQTDYLIKLPDGKHLIIDSKVALNAYDRAIAAESPEEYQLAMNEHLKAVRKHIDDLAAKDYTNLVGMRSPSFVLMFMPIEPAYIEALKNNKDLFEYGYKKGVVLVSHTTLIPILRTVSNLWMIERSNAEAREIGEKAGDIFNQVCIVAERLSKLGGTLSTVSNHYNNTVKALAGQQGLYGKVERFSQLSAKVSKNLPQLEAAHMDFESERLSLIVEPIEEPEMQDLSVIAVADNDEQQEEQMLVDASIASTTESEAAENH